jgi:hypothetical protein
MMTGLKKIIQDVGMTGVTHTLLVGQEQWNDIRRMRIVTPSAVVVLEWIVPISLAAQQRNGWMTREAQISLPSVEHALPIGRVRLVTVRAESTLEGWVQLTLSHPRRNRMTGHTQVLFFLHEQSAMIGRMRIVARDAVALLERIMRVIHLKHMAHISMANPAQLIYGRDQMGFGSLDLLACGADHITARSVCGTGGTLIAAENPLERQPLNEGARAFPSPRDTREDGTFDLPAVACMTYRAFLQHEGVVYGRFGEVGDELRVALQTFKVSCHETGLRGTLVDPRVDDGCQAAQQQKEQEQ